MQHVGRRLGAQAESVKVARSLLDIVHGSYKVLVISFKVEIVKKRKGKR